MATLTVASTPNFSQRGIRLNAYVVIFAVATMLALTTASACKSITHLPSLL